MCKDCHCGSSVMNKQITVHVEGIKASSDAKIIEKALLELPGIFRVHIHTHDGQTKIDYHPTLVSNDEITKKIEVIGYKLKAV
ncbi:heavy-metal-associated domain-containing protein [Pelosinus sp. IPA-1]|uniref:heavy-metal-associated domain-containing protein n=1 Tax=Pelosinus sp. IPA-1 TaxID=3029569 RepID=UPI0024362347|nr:heavy-metal-associated domain-containing protein [Pelosinus sp. IPA-1]GMB01117.1 hypothetical protein PIPA1_39160 [Pelosinus sp. IPA-1]